MRFFEFSLTKAVAAGIGYVAFGLPGAVVGWGLGHLLSGQGARIGAGGRRGALSRERFFDVTFSVMGHIAKADGQVSIEEIRLAQRVMGDLGLNAARRARAQEMFGIGKHPNFDLPEALALLVEGSQGNLDLIVLFLQIQISGAWADGRMAAPERTLLLQIAAHLGISERDYRQLEAEVARMMGGQEQERAAKASSVTLESAYRTLGVERGDSDAAIKRAYRRAMSANHPDKLMARGLPKEMIRAATDRTVMIKDAFDRIMASRSSAQV